MAFKKDFGSSKKSVGRPPAKSKPAIKKDSPFQKFYKPEKGSETEPESRSRFKPRSEGDELRNSSKKQAGSSSNPFSKSKPFTQKFEADNKESRTKSTRMQFGKDDRFSSDHSSRDRRDDNRSSSDRPSRFSSDRPNRDDNRFSSDRPNRDARDGNRFSSDRPNREDNRFSSDRQSRDGRDDNRFSGDRPSREGRDDNRFSSDRSSRDRRDENQDSTNQDESRPSRSKKLFEDDFFSKGNDSGKSSASDRFSRDRDKPRKFEGDFSKKPFVQKSDDRKFGDRPSYGKPAYDKPAYDRPSYDKPSYDRPSFDRSDRPERKFSSERSDDRKPRSNFDDRNYSKPYGDKSHGNKSHGNKSNSDKKTTKPLSVEGDDSITRLNKYVAQSGLCSRRKAVDLIKAGEIWVNGAQELNPAYEMKETDEVTHKSVVLKKEQKLLYLLMNKPKNIITTTEDEKGRRTVLDLVAGRYDERVYPVGRLDRNTTGLLLLTNDGELAKKLAHPSHMVKKFYQVELDKNLKTSDIDLIKEGLNLEDGVAEVDAIDYIEGGKKNEVGVEIHIGKNRIVRRIFESLGYEVVKLDRTYYGGLTKKDLPRGFIRELSPQEVIMLKHFTNNRKKE